MNLSQLFDLSFRGRADSEALEWQDRTFTFADLDDRAARMVGELSARGVRSGDRVAVFLPNGLTLIDVYLACVRIGAVFLPINILYKDRELSHIFADAEPIALVTDRDPSDLPAGVPVWNAAELDTALKRRDPDRAARPLDGETPAMLVYTSGTTGRAKGAVLSHNNLIANAVTLLVTWQITDRDRLLLTLPLFHVHGLGNGLHCWIASGCRTRLVERFDHTTIAAEFLSFAPTLFFGVPTMYSRLLDLDLDTARHIGSSMRLFVSGSAALAPAVFEAFQARFGHTILERFGMSETLMTISNPYLGERRPGAIGVPLPGVSARILDDQGRDVADGEAGELAVKGPTVFNGYWRNDDATRAAFVDGYFRTGDVASRDADGVYTLKGRKGDLIISGGFNIYARELELVIEEHPAVAEAAVIGTPDERRGEVPLAFVVLRREADLEAQALGAELERYCRTRLASFKIPRGFLSVDELPRNAMGKVQKHLLRKR